MKYIPYIVLIFFLIMRLKDYKSLFDKEYVSIKIKKGIVLKMNNNTLFFLIAGVLILLQFDVVNFFSVILLTSVFLTFFKIETDNEADR